MNEQKDTKLLISPQLQEAFYLRMLGLTYKVIAEKTGYSESWLRKSFTKGGALFDQWQHYKTVAQENSIDEAFAMMYGQLPDIMRANIIDAKTTDSMVGVVARKLIFESILPKQPAKFEGSMLVTTLFDLLKLARDNEPDTSRDTTTADATERPNGSIPATMGE